MSWLESDGIVDPQKFMWDDGSEGHWLDDDGKPIGKSAVSEDVLQELGWFYANLRDLAFALAAHRQKAALDHVTEAADALLKADADAVEVQVFLAKNAIPSNLIQGVIQNLFSSLAQMMETTVSQLRTVASPLGPNGTLAQSLGFNSSPNMAGWPTL